MKLPRSVVAGAVIAVLGAGSGVAVAVTHPGVQVHRDKTPAYHLLPAAELPPECVNARIVENSGSGPTLYVRWCGTGSAGEPPMDATTFVIVDGGPMTPAACTKINPCVVQWPASPAS